MLLNLVLSTVSAKSPKQQLQQHQKDHPERYLVLPSPVSDDRGNSYDHPAHSQTRSESTSHTPFPILAPSLSQNAGAVSATALDSHPRNTEMNDKFSKRSYTDEQKSDRGSSHAYPPPTTQADHDLFRSMDHVPRTGDIAPFSEFIELKTVRKDRLEDNSKRDHGADLERAIESLSIAEGRPRPTELAPVLSTGSTSYASSRIDSVRLNHIRSKVVAFLLHRFSVHDYTVPRLFIVLPDPTSTHGDEPVNNYRLYFLCECSPSFTLPLGSGLNHLHIAKHTGYAIEPGRKDEFFRRYGPMVLTLLIFLKYGQDPQTSPDSAPTSLSKQPSQVQDIKEARHENQHLLKRVEKLCNLRRSDLPPAIAQDVDVKVARMIEFLESFLSLGDNTKSSGSQSTGESGNQDSESDTVKDTKKPNTEDTKEPLQGLVNLADLHELYTYLGMASLSARLLSGQLGNLFRVSNVKGQVSWVCTYHYRWTFMEKNVDDFAKWIVSLAPSLIEVHLKLGWLFAKKDLWRLARAIAQSTVTVLSLDGCAEDDDPGYMSIHKKYDPILHMISHGQIHSLELRRFPSFFARISQKTVKAPSLRKLELGPGMMSYRNL
ncbi:hypothetical protein BGZ92_002769 [Podila epicladia]|nr:hypothetical protein BGZ92_002769 [Podila epicladia]